jgi:hypothetical protein
MGVKFIGRFVKLFTTIASDSILKVISIEAVEWRVSHP